ncbi:hypothetical protein BBOV_III002930 [Babesia bovis T2Bo]|uniref:Uncharacterized protein n=1 Tax=Babesia bovis TaxID=5865 RepID=A7AMS3_BABBO|nr:hypothetical protein BBOV_III002930 [Babesia bovis T2Bo]EDO07857.1 hypothetical protein BBOV_III002930 [Babesia bovis T2Bo]|eukprot:XP_001611425.1 hypothetical protein [Babesia bovis T2Bo]
MGDIGVNCFAIESAARDLDLLDDSICDFIVAVGGSIEGQNGFHQQQLQVNPAFVGFKDKAGLHRLRVFRNVLKGLDLHVSGFMQVLHLHIRRGAAWLKRCPEYLDSDVNGHAINRTSGDASNREAAACIVTSLNSVSGLSRESLVDMVEGRDVQVEPGILDKITNEARAVSSDVDIFCRYYMDPVMDLYENVLMRVCRVDIYDCIRLRCYFINLDNILSMNDIRYVRIRNSLYAIMLRLTRFALRNAWWIRTNGVEKKVPFLCEDIDDRCGVLKLGDLRNALNAVSIVSGQHGTLDTRIFRDLARVLDLKHDESVLWSQLMGSLEDDEVRDVDYVMFKKVVDMAKESWVDVMMASLVTIANVLLFETFSRYIDSQGPPHGTVDAFERLEMLSGMVELLHEVDFGYTAWVVDILGSRADSSLVTAFRVHGDLLLKGDGGSNKERLKRLQWGDGVLVYIATLQRIKHVFRKTVLALVNRIVEPALDIIEDRKPGQLWWELLYSDDKLLIGPKGELSNVIRGCTRVVRDAICVELFSRVISAFGAKVTRGGYSAERIIFNSMAIWDSFCNINLGPADTQSSYHIGLLFDCLERIKMGYEFDQDDPSGCSNDFWANVLSTSDKQVAPKSHLDLLDYVVHELDNRCTPMNYTWIAGDLRHRLALFGGMVLLFNDESSLQPVGMLDMLDVIAVYAIEHERRSNMNMSESDAELYSCGTTDSESPRELSGRYIIENSLLLWGWGLRVRFGGRTSVESRSIFRSGRSVFKCVDFEFLAPEHRERWLRSLKSYTSSRQNHMKATWWPERALFLEVRE